MARNYGKRWEIKDSSGRRVLTRSDLTVSVNGEIYGRANYWCDLLGLSKGRVSQLLDELDHSELEKKILEFSPMNVEVREERVKRPGRVRYVNKEIIQEVIDRYDDAKVLSDSISIPTGINNEDYQTAHFWKEFFKEEGINSSTSQVLRTSFFRELKNFPSYVKEVDGIKVRAYHKTDAKKAMRKAVRLIK